MPTLQFTQNADLFLDLRGSQYPAQFFTSRYSTAQRQPQFVQGDTVLLRLWLCDTPSYFGEAAPLLLANGPIAFAIKAIADATAPLLAFTSSFEFVDSSPEEDGSEGHYEALLDLNTEELNTAFAEAENQRALTFRLDIELQSQGNAQRLTFAREIQIVRQAYQGTETDPVPATPAYPAPGDIPSKNEMASEVASAIAAFQGAIPRQIAESLADSISGIVAAVPRITRVSATTLPPGANATAQIISPDPEADPNDPATARTQLLSLGIAQGASGGGGNGNGNSSGLPSWWVPITLNVTYQFSGTFVPNRPGQVVETTWIPFDTPAVLPPSRILYWVSPASKNVYAFDFGDSGANCIWAPLNSNISELIPVGPVQFYYDSRDRSRGNSTGGEYHPDPISLALLGSLKIDTSPWIMEEGGSPSIENCAIFPPGINLPGNYYEPPNTRPCKKTNRFLTLSDAPLGIENLAWKITSLQNSSGSTSSIEPGNGTIVLKGDARIMQGCEVEFVCPDSSPIEYGGVLVVSVYYNHANNTTTVYFHSSNGWVSFPYSGAAGYWLKIVNFSAYDGSGSGGSGLSIDGSNIVHFATCLEIYEYAYVGDWRFSSDGMGMVSIYNQSYDYFSGGVTSTSGDSFSPNSTGGYCFSNSSFGLQASAYPATFIFHRDYSSSYISGTVAQMGNSRIFITGFATTEGQYHY